MLSLALLALGCGSDEPAPGFDYEALCGERWVEDDCADGCADSDLEAV